MPDMALAGRGPQEPLASSRDAALDSGLRPAYRIENLERLRTQKEEEEEVKKRKENGKKNNHNSNKKKKRGGREEEGCKNDVYWHIFTS